jgi:hypothetical protein
MSDDGPAGRISLGQQIDAVRFAAERQGLLSGGGALRDQRPESVRDYELRRLGAAIETLTWLRDNAEAVKAAYRALAVAQGDGMGGGT